MFREATPLLLICETPLHAGSGDDLGVVDLPIQRERHTSFPKIEGSSLKGSLREAFENKLTETEERKKIHLAFGYDDKTPEDKAVKDHFGEDKQFQGALGFTDARLLLFPVKSMKGVFAWITCKRVIEQFRKDLELSDCNWNGGVPKANTVPNVPNKCELLFSENKVVLEEYTFKVTIDDDTTKLAQWLADKLFEPGSYWHGHLSKNLVVLSDDDFTDFVNLSTEVITRTKINNETGTVQDGALFTEEYLPSESVLYSLALFSPLFHTDDKIKPIMPETWDGVRNQGKEVEAVKEFFKKRPPVVQIGGNATLGKGLVRTKLVTSVVETSQDAASSGGDKE
ncbi:MAG: type III-B CRISPR module RAMP protein Cmr4 [Chlorobiaceae bacterium]|nr:type III-B CRISPR module RAMP protein Cmr4 [Chlorobiaceae bacterium]